jgi:hypothetical protein
MHTLVPGYFVHGLDLHVHVLAKLCISSCVYSHFLYWKTINTVYTRIYVEQE